VGARQSSVIAIALPLTAVQELEASSRQDDSAAQGWAILPYPINRILAGSTDRCMTGFGIRRQGPLEKSSDCHLRPMGAHDFWNLGRRWLISTLDPRSPNIILFAPTFASGVLRCWCVDRILMRTKKQPDERKPLQACWCRRNARRAQEHSIDLADARMIDFLGNSGVNGSHYWLNRPSSSLSLDDAAMLNSRHGGSRYRCW